MIRLLYNPRGNRGSRAVGLLSALALTTLGSVFSAGPADATGSCGTPSTSGGYSVTACGAYGPDGSYTGWLYVTLPAGHASCTIRGKVIYAYTTSGYAQSWPCPAGAITNVRYDIDFAANGEAITSAGIRNSSGYSIVNASSDF
ncbi:MAG TPA: hypothetical protein VF557_03735 [Jatrophihabitans sp.]|uniref:hypothetical protein n=1 Tax=Jatrophihabitans sp. TaxID=1932789 RepID=UPI002EEF09F2